MNGTAELLSGLSNIPLFMCGIAMYLSAARSRRKGNIRKNWMIIAVLLCFTVIIGIFVHTVRIGTGLLRIIWPLVFLAITELVRRFWLQMIRVLRGEETLEEHRKVITVFAFVTAAVNGFLKLFFDTDMAPLFCIFAVPAVLSILWMALTGKREENAGIRRAVVAGMLLMLASTLADGVIRRPIDILGIPCTGALFGHILMCAALIIFISVIGKSSREER